MAKKIAIFGGSFDPIHKGHLALARAAAEQADLDELYFVTAKESPGKKNVMDAAMRHRCVEEAIADLQGEQKTKFFASRFELEAESPSYSYKTIEHFQQEFPAAEIFWLMGEDAFASLDSWKNAEKFLEINVLVYPRQEQKEYPVPSLFAEAKDSYRYIEADYVDISSTQLRDLLKNQPKDLENHLSELVPKSIWGFIARYSWE